jgi:hypothetical protein
MTLKTQAEEDADRDERARRTHAQAVAYSERRLEAARKRAEAEHLAQQPKPEEP